MEHSLRLELSVGFEFKNAGTASFDDTSSDAVGTPTTSIMNSNRSLVIHYNLCNGANCTANILESDVLTISGVFVAATGTNLVPGTIMKF